MALSLMIKDIQLLKNYNKIQKKIEKLMKIDFNTKTTQGNDDKYIKTRIKTYKYIRHIRHIRQYKYKFL